MEEALASPHKSSDLDLPVNKRKEKKADPLASNLITWSSRYKCFQAYICYVMSYLSCLKFCERVGKFKVTIFFPYLLCNVFIGVPAVLVEVMIGRFVMGNMVHVWNMCIPAKGIFWCLMIITVYAIIVNCMYKILLLKYFFASLRSHLQWDKCNSSWTKENCYNVGHKSDAMINCLKNNSEDYCKSLKWETSGMQFWKYITENATDINEICLSFLYLGLSVITAAAIIYKGIRSLEKVLGLLVYLSVFFWFLFVIVSFTASNALSGFKRLFHISWDEFIKHELWVAGFEDTFYLLGLGRFCLSFISSHGKFKDNILYDVVIVIFSSVVSCLLITTPTLSIISVIKQLDGTNQDDVFFKDQVDVFVSVSDALLFYPYPNNVWSAVYYLDCFLISLSSQAILVLSLCEALHAVFNKTAFFLIIIIVSLFCFITAGSVIFLPHIFEINHATFVITTVILCTITWQLFYGITKFNYDYFFMLGYPITIFLRFTWITLLLLPLVGLVFKMYYKIPDKPIKDIVYIYFGIILFIYIVTIVIYAIKFRREKTPISSVFMANPDWGPDNALLKRSRSVFETSALTREFMYRQELFKKPFVKPPNFTEQNIVQLI